MREYRQQGRKQGICAYRSTICKMAFCGFFYDNFAKKYGGITIKRGRFLWNIY